MKFSYFEKVGLAHFLVFSFSSHMRWVKRKQEEEEEAKRLLVLW